MARPGPGEVLAYAEEIKRRPKARWLGTPAKQLEGYYDAMAWVFGWRSVNELAGEQVSSEIPDERQISDLVVRLRRWRRFDSKDERVYHAGVRQVLEWIVGRERKPVL